MPQTFFHIRRRESDKTRAENVLQLLRLYKAKHSLQSIFDALAEIVEKETASKPQKN